MYNFKRNGVRGHKLSFIERHITYPVKNFFNQDISIKTVFWTLLIVIFVGTGMGFRSLFPWLSEASVRIETARAETPKSMIEYVLMETRRAGMDSDKVALLISCESGWREDAMLINKGGSLGVDLGLWQINTKFHPEVSKSCSLDYKCATLAAIKIWNDSGKSFKEWSCAKKLNMR